MIKNQTNIRKQMIESGFVECWKRNGNKITGNSEFLSFSIVLKGTEGKEWRVERRYSEFLKFHLEVNGFILIFYNYYSCCFRLRI